MAEFELDIPMPTPYRNLLIGMVETAKEQGDYSIVCSELGRGQVHINTRGMNRSISFDCPGFPLDYFKSQGLLQAGPGAVMYILPKTLKWCDYQKKGPFGKRIVRAIYSGKDILLGISFVGTLLLTILEILKFTGVITTP